jgi:RNA polymerase sigma-70 factor (ECF subfamily)
VPAFRPAFVWEGGRRVGEYLAEPAVPFYVWLRFLAVQRMQMVQRAHLGAQRRDVSQEVALPRGDTPFASSESMAGRLVSRMTSPSQAAIRHELRARLRAALDGMDPLDREGLALRHFEELGNNEAAQILGISKDAASKRHVRALRREGAGCRTVAQGGGLRPRPRWIRSAPAGPESATVWGGGGNRGRAA